MYGLSVDTPESTLINPDRNRVHCHSTHQQYNTVNHLEDTRTSPVSNSIRPPTCLNGEHITLHLVYVSVCLLGSIYHHAPHHTYSSTHTKKHTAKIYILDGPSALLCAVKDVHDVHVARMESTARDMRRVLEKQSTISPARIDLPFDSDAGSSCG